MPRFRLFLVVATLTLCGSQSLLRAQDDFKGVRLPNPEVRRPSRPAPDRRAGAKQTKPTLSEQIEAALESGNDQLDAAKLDAPPESTRDSYQEAEKDYRKVLALNPNEPRGYHGLGNALAGQERYAEAEAAYRQALLLSPRYVEVYLALGNLSRYQGQSEQDAIDYYKKAISIKPDFDHAYIAIGYLYARTERASEAITWYQDAIRHKPNSSLAYIHLGDLYSGQKRHDEAIHQYKQAIRLRDREGYQNLADLYAGLKRYPEAIEVYQQWIRFKPEADAYFFLGSLYDDSLKRYPEAIKAYQQAVSRERDNEYYRYTLGLAYLKANNKNGAIEQYRELKRVKSDFADDLLEEINKK